MNTSKIDKMVERFLSWRLPKDFHPDGGVVFLPTKGRGYDSLHWPVGTNLFTADQTRQMFNHVTAEEGHETLLPHQQRVVDEKAELDQKLDALHAFQDGPLFPRLTSAEQARMNLQAHYMARYSEILGERIAAFQRDVEQAARSVA